MKEGNANVEHGTLNAERRNPNDGDWKLVWMRAEVARDVAGLVAIRHSDIGETRDEPGAVVDEACGISWLVQWLEENLLGEDWSAGDLEASLAVAVDLAATATRLAEALRLLQLRRAAAEGGSTLPWRDSFEGHPMEAWEEGEFPEDGEDERRTSNVELPTSTGPVSEQPACPCLDGTETARETRNQEQETGDQGVAP